MPSHSTLYTAYTIEEEIPIYNFTSGAILAFEGPHLIAICTYECMVLCLDYGNNVTNFTYDGDKSPHHISLLPGDYRCAVLSGGSSRETLHCITVKAPGTMYMYMHIWILYVYILHSDRSKEH